MGIHGGLVDRLAKHRFVHVVGATAGDEEAARIQQSEGPEVDLLVSGQRLGHRRLVLREGGGVEHDGVVAGAVPFEVAQLVEHVGLSRGEVGDAVGGGVAGDPGDRVGRDVERFDAVQRGASASAKPPL